MIEKITALVFGLLALLLEVAISIKTPTVESVTAAVFALVIVVCVAISLRRTVTLCDVVPNGKRPVDRVFKLANEIAPYVKEKNGKIYVKVVK